MKSLHKKLLVVLLLSGIGGYGLLWHTAQVSTAQKTTLSSRVKDTHVQTLYTELRRAEKNDDVPSVLLLLKIIVDDAVQQGEHAPEYNLCELQIPHTDHRFCAFNKGIKRLNMPQLKGVPVPGSKADQLPRDERHEVDGSQAFVEYLRAKGYTMNLEEVPVVTLKATQNEIIGSKVAGIWYAMQDPTSDAYRTITSMPLFISRDNYILDGHHRWAAAVAHGISNGDLASVHMKAERVDVGIDQLVRDAHDFTRQFGIQPEEGLA